MNIIARKNIKFEDEISFSSENFKETLKKKEEDFLDSFDKKYSKEFFEDYSLNTFRTNGYIQYFLPGNIFFFVLMMLCTEMSFNIYTFFLFLFLFISSVSFHCVILLKPLKKTLNRYWLKNEENRNSVKKEIFMNNLVEKNLLKTFANTYGKDALKELLDENESITYKNIISYIMHHDSIEQNAKKIDERSMRLNEIVNCITSDNT